jgi:hypothetical protein
MSLLLSYNFVKVNLRFLIFRLGRGENGVDVAGQKVEQSGYIWSLHWNETHYYSKLILLGMRAPR